MVFPMGQERGQTSRIHVLTPVLLKPDPKAYEKGAISLKQNQTKTKE